jgi:hypothetical protein
MAVRPVQLRAEAKFALGDLVCVTANRVAHDRSHAGLLYIGTVVAIMTEYRANNSCVVRYWVEFSTDQGIDEGHSYDETALELYDEERE